MSNVTDQKAPINKEIKPFFIYSHEDAVAAGEYFFQLEGQEGYSTHVLYIDKRSLVVGFKNLVHTQVTKETINPGVVFEPALLLNAAAVLIIQKRPTLNLMPKVLEIDVMRALRKCGELLSINVLDLVNVNYQNQILSLKDQKYID